MGNGYLGNGHIDAPRDYTPLSIVVGQADEVTPAATNAQRYARLIQGAKLTVLPGRIGHYTFLAVCTPHGKSVLPICRDAEGIERTAVHSQVSQMAFDFFERVWAVQ